MAVVKAAAHFRDTLQAGPGAKHNPGMNRLHRIAPLCLLALVLGACTSVPRGPATVPASAATAPAVVLPTLASEQKRLGDLFADTPVTVQRTADDRLRLHVPLRFSFDAGRAAVKPPLAALLDRLATSLRQQSGFGVRINASGDSRGAGASQLARERAAATRDYLIAKGAPANRFGEAGGLDEGVELLISERAR